MFGNYGNPIGNTVKNILTRINEYIVKYMFLKFFQGGAILIARHFAACGSFSYLEFFHNGREAKFLR
jgi:hypothetical protein